MRQQLTAIWTNAPLCFFLTPILLFFSGIAFLGAVGEAFSNFADGCRSVGSNCHEPRDLVIVPLGLAGIALLGLGASTLLRGVFLTGRGILRRLA